ncbi:hypothetical protein [Candidatus Amarolinea dominans]|uniref:hypothetical protein n=1 Tax=Candidatus Amarolinea dominans TaxID=3140696 RepID=UPI001D4100E5|nr:enoyl-CoA hydratase/isomerase family protein [Anaerolineae bacterium]
MTEELILTQQRDNVFEIILNRPDKRNALNWPMLRALPGAVAQARRAAGVRHRRAWQRQGLFGRH